MSRLPSVGGDDGNWGTILNDYLSVSHNSDGTLKNPGLSADYQAALGKFSNNAGGQGVAGFYDPAGNDPTVGGYQAWAYAYDTNVTRFTWGRNGNDAGPVAWLELVTNAADNYSATLVLENGSISLGGGYALGDAYRAFGLTMAVGQTQSPFSIKDSSSNDVVSVSPDPGSSVASVTVSGYGEAGATYIYGGASAHVDIVAPSSQGDSAFTVRPDVFSTVFAIEKSGAISKLNNQNVPVTGVAVTTAAVHAALVTLGLITT